MKSAKKTRMSIFIQILDSDFQLLIADASLLQMSISGRRRLPPETMTKRRMARRRATDYEA